MLTIFGMFSRSAMAPAVAGPSSWLSGLNSPLIQEDGDNKKLKLRFDVAQYTPEEIVVKTVDNKLHVHAKHEEKSDTKSVYREYNREFLLPKGTDPEQIRSSLSKVSINDEILHVCVCVLCACPSVD